MGIRSLRHCPSDGLSSFARHDVLQRCTAALLAIATPFCAAEAQMIASDAEANAAARISLAPMLGAHTLLWQENQVGTSPAVTDPIATGVSGSSFVAFSAGYISNDRPPTDNKGNGWRLLGEPVVYHGNNAAFDVKAYIALGGAGGVGHAVSIVKPGEPAGEISVPFVEIRNANVLVDVAQNYPSGNLLASGRVTTTGPAVLLAFWWGDGDGLTHTAVPGDGFSVIDALLDLPPLSAVQCVVAFKEVQSAGIYSVTWTQDQSLDPGAALWLFAFQSGNDDVIFQSRFD